MKVNYASPLFSHKQYLRFVGRKAGGYGRVSTRHRYYPVWLKLKATNLERAYPHLSCLYSENRGRWPRCPLSMLRSCLAMLLCGQTSFDAWVSLMRDEPFYALISGFDPADVPGVGTFYDFQDRLLHRPRQPRTRKQVPHYRREQRDKRAEQKDKNDVRPHQNIINRLADRILARSQRPTPLAAVLEGLDDLTSLPVWEQTLQPLFLACFVAHSVELKLIDLNNLHVAGDGWYKTTHLG